jgi:hypothetical protein
VPIPILVFLVKHLLIVGREVIAYEQLTLVEREFQESVTVVMITL